MGAGAKQQQGCKQGRCEKDAAIWMIEHYLPRPSSRSQHEARDSEADNREEALSDGFELGEPRALLVGAKQSKCWRPQIS